MWGCVEQAERNCPAGATPCLVFTRNRTATYAVLPWSAVLALYARRPPARLPPRVRTLVAELARLVDDAPGHSQDAEEAEDPGTGGQQHHEHAPADRTLGTRDDA